MGRAASRAVWSTFLATFIAPIPAVAQTIPSPYRYIELGQEATAFVGHFAAPTGRFGFGPKAGTSIGTRYSVALTNSLAFEFTGTYLASTRDVVTPRGIVGAEVISEAEANLAIVDVRLRMNLTGRRTWHGLQPFVALGGGLAWNASGRQREDLDLLPEDQFSFGSAFLGVVGGGVRLFINDRVVLRGDANFNLYSLETPRGWLDAELELRGVGEKESVSAAHYTIGLTWQF